MDPTPEQAQPADLTGEGQSGAGPAGGQQWSPLRTRKARWSWGLMAVFTVIYFSVAVLTSAELADLAAALVVGLPLGFWLGIGVVIAGLVITRLYLVKVED